MNCFITLVFRIKPRILPTICSPAILPTVAILKARPHGQHVVLGVSAVRFAEDVGCVRQLQSAVGVGTARQQRTLSLQDGSQTVN